MLRKAIDLSHPMVGQCRVSGAGPITSSQCGSSKNVNAGTWLPTGLSQHCALFPHGE